MNAEHPPALPVGRGRDSLRRHNLATVLERVHHSGGVSRSRLTGATGLNRSTIAALVTELVVRGLVEEVDPVTTNQVGRPSPIVRPDPRTVVIAVNPEVDAISVAVVGLGGVVRERVRRPMDAAPDVAQAVAVITQTVDELAGRHPAPLGMGIAVPGLVRAADGLVRLAPHLGWRDEPLAARLSRATGLPVAAANDAGLGAAAEHVFGAGRGLTDFVYLNGGASGIGGGIIAGGVPLRGAGGYAGEFGHTLVTARGDRDRAGAPGSVELELTRATLLRALGLDDADADGLERALVASESADVAAEVDRQLAFLGVVLRNAVDILNPQRIVLGGFLASLDAAVPGRLDALLREQALAVSLDEVRVVRAELGSDILLIGAAELAFAGLLADPASVR
ncbi:MAG: hypothetical protein RI885_96 [Actinomycetota bacterium]|jgi:predicted NBD/HSP70 family sugar kinase